MIAVHDEILTGDPEDPLYDEPGITAFITREGARALLAALDSESTDEHVQALISACTELTGAA